MSRILVSIRGRLEKPGEKEIDLEVSSYRLGSPSPFYVSEDGARILVGGDCESLQRQFQIEVAKHPGYVVRELRVSHA